MIVKALMENTACSGEFSAEHGLSLYLEACGHKFLFDTAQSGALSENAGKLGVDLADIILRFCHTATMTTAAGCARF